MSTQIVIEVSEEVKEKAQARAIREGTTLNAVIQKFVEEFATREEILERIKEGMKIVPKAKFVKIGEVDPHQRLTPQEVQESLAALEKLRELGAEVGKNINGMVDAVELVREVRRDL
jgi:predicted transcriptional regulator